MTSIREGLLSSLQRGLALAIVTLLCFSFFWYNGIYRSIGLTALTVVNLAGVYVGYLLLLKQLDIRNSYTDKICSLFKQSDCNNVLESSAAKLFGFIGWSEIGLGYFIANCLVLIFFPSLVSYLAVINICSLPYTAWSIWYQAIKVKQWCPLCLIVQGILWLIFFISISSGFIQIPLLDWLDGITIIALYVIPAAVINMLLPQLSAGMKLEKVTQEMNGLKMKDEVFTVLLNRQKCYPVNKETSHIVLGNPNASMQITILTNPHCAPCARMHERIGKLLNNSGDRISVRYVFSSFNEQLDSSGKFLIAAYLQLEYKKAMAIYDEWYKEGKFDKDNFFKKYASVSINDEVEYEYASHQKWKKETQLMATPTILINGYELPNDYKIEDMEYFK